MARTHTPSGRTDGSNGPAAAPASFSAPFAPGRLVRRALAATAAFAAAVAVSAGGALAFAPAASAAPLVLDSTTALAATAPAPGAKSPSMGTGSATERFGACLAGGGQADILMVFDESSSLADTDPNGARVSSANYFVDRVSASMAAAKVPAAIGVTTFGHTSETLVPFTATDAAGVAVIKGGISQVGQRVGGFDTDYWTALDSSRSTLAERARTGGPSHCQAIVFFSDGKLDYSPRTTSVEQQLYGTTKPFAPGVELTTQDAANAVRQAAQTDICRAGGLADQLASSNVALFGIGLTPNPAAAASDFDLLQSIMTGTGSSGATCGTIISPPHGEFHLASDIDGLLLAFDSISTPGKRPITQDSGICQGQFCADQAHRFVLDASTPEVRILATADIDGLTAGVQTPAGTVVQLPNAGVGAAQPFSQDGVTGTYTWESNRSLSIEISKAQADDPHWSGLWQFAFIDPASRSAGHASHSNIHISGTLQPSIEGADGFSLGADSGQATITPRIVDRSGASVVASTLLGDVDFSGEFADASGKVVPLFQTTDKAAMGQPATLDTTGLAIGRGSLVLRLGITTASARLVSGETIPGTRLEPAVVEIPVDVRPPADYPTLSELIDFGAVDVQPDSAVEAHGTLTVTGSGCAWIEPDAPVTVSASPADLGAVHIAAAGMDRPDLCFQATSEGNPLTVVLTTDQPGFGSINGTVPVHIAAGNGSGEQIVVDVPFTADLRHPVSVAGFALGFLAALVAGIGIPVGLLYLAKFAVAKIPGRPLSAALIPVRVEHGEVSRDGAPFETRPEDLVGTVALRPRGERRVVAQGVTLEARMGASPMAGGFVVVDAPGRLSASGESPSTGRSGVQARLPLAVHNTWTVVRTPGSPAEEASVLLLLESAGDARSREKIADDVRRRLPAVLERLVARDTAVGAMAVAGAGPGDGNPFGGSGQPAPGANPFSSPGGGVGGPSGYGGPGYGSGSQQQPGQGQQNPGQGPGPGRAPGGNPWGPSSGNPFA